VSEASTPRHPWDKLEEARRTGNRSKRHQQRGAVAERASWVPAEPL